MVRCSHLFPIRAASLAMVHDGRPSQPVVFRLLAGRLPFCDP